MLLAQLHETESLQAISDSLLNEDLQQEFGFASISVSMNPFTDLVSQIKLAIIFIYTSFHHSCKNP